MRSVQIAYRLLLGIVATSLIVGGLAATQAFSEEDDDSPAISNEMPDYDRSIAFFQTRIKQQPKVSLNYVMLAQRYSRKAKETGAEECYALAETALKQALDLAPKDVSARLSMSGVLGFRHEFAASLKLAEQVAVEFPEELDALAAIHDAQVGLGDDAAAAKSLSELIKRSKGPSIGLLVRQAHLADLHGQDDEALKLMQQANGLVLEAAGDYRSPGIVWFQVRLGHQLLDMGQIEPAAKQFESAAQAMPKYFLAIAGLAEVRAAQGRFDESLKLYADTIQLCPDPIFFMAVGDIHTHLGHAEAAQSAYATAEQTILDSGATPAEFARELSLFYSERDHQSAKAVELARTDLKHRHDIFGHDALAWALYRDGQFDAAAKASEQALATGSRHAKLHYHAGMIQHRLGHTAAARQHLTHALAHNPVFSVLDVNLARQTLKELAR